MRHLYVTFEPDGRHILIHEGATVFEAAAAAGIILNSVCGGKGICRKCIVKILPEGCESPACQYHIHSDINVVIPESSRFFEQKILAQGLDVKEKIQPDIYKKYLNISPGGKIFGLAVDTGTTTVAAKLLDMTTGRCLATEADLNPQMKYGDDVISRIHHAASEQKQLHLQSLIIDCLNKLIARFCRKASIDSSDIYELCVVGNTTMNHLFLTFPVSQLGQAPYEAFNLDACDRKPQALGLQINPAGNIHTAPNIAGFVGADTTAVALAVGVDLEQEQTLVVDIGTNGEIVLGTKDKLCAASCAAGPALEGARISCGSRAVDGAVQAVVANADDIDIDVIGGGPAVSICGSGLIDAMAVLLNLGIVEPTGRFASREKLQDRLPQPILARMVAEHGTRAFALAGDSKGQTIVLTQNDVRQVQLAKAAVRAAIMLLQKEIGLLDSDIKQVYVAGAFGNYIRPESALRIGLLPQIDIERIRFVGNAACSGAEMMLLSSECRKQAQRLAKRIDYIEIAHHPDFQDVFANCMTF